MANWKDLLKNASIERSLQRAHTGLEETTTYVLGQGGFDPTKMLTKKCDCSGFIAWAIGIPREFPPGSNRWLDTDAYWNGGGAAAKAAGFPLLQNVAAADAEPGDLIVYPDQGGKQGHIGIISGLDNQGELKVIHCSKGNFNKFGDATRETDSAVWKIQAKTRFMRIDFDAMRRYAGVTGETPVIDVPVMVAGGALDHSLLATDATLQLVSKGKLELTPTGKRVSGIAAVQQAMNILARERAEFAIDLGVNEANIGIFGPRTEAALKKLQADLSLPQTGALDAATLLGMDELLVKASEKIVPEDTSAIELPSSPATAIGNQPLVFELTREGASWFASTQGERFFVGNRVPFQGRLGLMNLRDQSSPFYDPAEYTNTFGHWAHFIAPTVKAESRGHFNCLNTYDRAGFTFGFLQFAAHVADGDFVKFFRALLQLDERTAYFPDLELRDGRIVQPTENGVVRLETAASSDALKRYLNPSGGEVENREVLSAARFVHWCAHSKAHRETQVKVGVDTVRQKLRTAHNKINLDGRGDKVCFVVMDILHQGRGTFAAMKQIIQNNNDAVAYQKLLTIGASNFPERIETIRAEVARLEAAGHFGTRKYSGATNDLV
ncbi:MAG TPA: peptidoglycan-binding domain-containing protein [Pyrinomonadaceae bacterium]|nr:peptidoglycan-binding domain-containing protein [Pyrinomonadaceae bacterium]